MARKVLKFIEFFIYLYNYNIYLYILGANQCKFVICNPQTALFVPCVCVGMSFSCYCRQCLAFETAQERVQGPVGPEPHTLRVLNPAPIGSLPLTKNVVHSPSSYSTLCTSFNLTHSLPTRMLLLNILHFMMPYFWKSVPWMNLLRVWKMWATETNHFPLEFEHT